MLGNWTLHLLSHSTWPALLCFLQIKIQTGGGQGCVLAAETSANPGPSFPWPEGTSCGRLPMATLQAPEVQTHDLPPAPHSLFFILPGPGPSIVLEPPKLRLSVPVPLPWLPPPCRLSDAVGPGFLSRIIYPAKLEFGWQHQIKIF